MFGSRLRRWIIGDISLDEPILFHFLSQPQALTLLLHVSKCQFTTSPKCLSLSPLQYSKIPTVCIRTNTRKRHGFLLPTLNSRTRISNPVLVSKLHSNPHCEKFRFSFSGSDSTSRLVTSGFCWNRTSRTEPKQSPNLIDSQLSKSTQTNKTAVSLYDFSGASNQAS